MLVQRWGIFWCPLKQSMHNRGVAVHVACQLHNICITDVLTKFIKPVTRGSVPGFEHELNILADDDQAGFCNYTEGTAIGRGYVPV